MITLKLLAQSMGLFAFSAALPVSALNFVAEHSDLLKQPTTIAVLDNLMSQEHRMLVKTSARNSGVMENHYLEVVTPNFEAAQTVCEDVRILGDEFTTYTIMTRRSEIIALNQVNPVEFSFKISEQDLNCYNSDRVASL